MQLITDMADLLEIIGAVWIVKGLKSRAVAFVQNKYLGGVQNTASGLNRMLNSFGYLLDWVIYIVAILLSISAFGFDISALLASFGASSVIIGIASRSALENFAAAISLVRKF